MSVLLVSPAEPREYWCLGKSSTLPEKYGADFLFATEQAGLVGIQRKRFPDDFLASLRGNDRISRELQQMKQLDYGIWILEGMGQWTNDGYLVYGGRFKYYEEELWGFQLSVGKMGYNVFRVRDQQSTIKLIKRIQIWALKDEHNSLFCRPKPSRWGESGSREWALHFLQGLPGIGYAYAERIFDAFGQLPFKGEFTFEEMSAACGPARAKVICELFGVEVKVKVKTRIRNSSGSDENRGRIV